MSDTKPPRSRHQYEADLRRECVATFAEHTIASRSEGRWVLKRNGTEGNFWCEVAALAGGFLLVHGDFDVCAWEGGSYRAPRDLVGWIGAHGNDLGYVTEKASRALDGHELTEERIGEVLRHDLADLLADWEPYHGEEPSDDVREAITDAIEQADDCTYQQEFDRLIESLMDDNVIDGEEASGLGCVTTRRVIRGWAAVNRLHTLLLAEESAENPQGDGKNPATGSVQGA